MDVRFLLHFSGFLLLAQPLSSSVEGDAGATGEAGDCTGGFPSLGRIDAVLGEITSFNFNAQGIVPSISFTCNGSILSWVFGADWEGNTDSFTELQIWRPGSEDGSYTKVGSTTIMVERNTARLYEYRLSSPLAFQAGDILGYYQGQFRLIFENVGSGHPVYFFPSLTATSYSTFRTDWGFVRFNDDYHVLVAVTTDPPDCGCGFMSVERIRGFLGARMPITTQNRQQITPDMRFTCDGMITKWIIGADWGYDGNDRLFPELQIWRRSGDDEYQKINGTVIDINTRNDDRVYEYPVSPIPFQAGDILGVFIPRDSRSKIRLRAESGRGPTNYFIPTHNSVTMSPFTNINIHQDTTSSAVYHPLVSVEIVVTTRSASVPVVTTTPSLVKESSGTTSQRTRFSFPSVSIYVQSMSTTATLVPSPEIAVSSELPSPDIAVSTESQSSLGAGIGGGVAVLLLLLVAVLAVTLLLVWRRKHTSKAVLQPAAADGGMPQLENPVYDGGSGNGNVIHGSKLAIRQGGINQTSHTDYELVGSRASQDNNREFDNPLYSDTGPVSTTETHTYYESTKTCLPTTGRYCVPTIEQRRRNTVEHGEQEPVYSVVDQREFFQEKAIYWAPASTVNGIYEQLSHHKYREISRQHIEISGSLGSGQFGVVSLGKWQSGEGDPVDVAVKTLRPSAKETDKVKFLQEAAVNGQFRHPNIVRLHGVVTVGEPVMIVLEFLPKGDLRDFLHSLKAQDNPPQQSELAQLCLSFSRQVAAGMSYLAGKSFVHRDLAARNILVSESTVCKVADFGMARDLDEDSYYVSRGGQIPVKWTAPEALHYKKYSTASDVWSFGCLMYEIWSLGHKPFEGYTNAEALKVVMKGHRLSPPPGCPRPVYSIMISCWHPEKSSRPSFPSLCQSLAEEPATLLQWREEDSQCHPQATILGAELEAGKLLYTELQQTYLQNNN